MWPHSRKPHQRHCMERAAGRNRRFAANQGGVAGDRHSGGDARSIGPRDGNCRQRHGVSRRLRPRSDPTGKRGGLATQHRCIAAGEAARGVCDPPALRSHRWISRLDLHPLDTGAAKSARGVRPEGDRGDDRASDRGVKVDIETRTNRDGNQRTFADGYKVSAHEIGAAGVVYEDANVKVTAFPTQHAMESYGYRFDTADRSVVISGDTNPSQTTIDACKGCDVLIHEVHTEAWLAARPEAGGAPPGTFRSFSEKYHTTTRQLGRTGAAGTSQAIDPLSLQQPLGGRTTVRHDEALSRPVRNRSRPGCVLVRGWSDCHVL